ncbi:hypothetical protein [Neobacillus sp. LXY-1]
METVCNICGSEKDDFEEHKESNVLIICDNCLKEIKFSNLIEQFFS